MGTVVHAPRLAWDGARMLVQAARGDLTFAWMTDRLGPLWSDELAEQYRATQQRLRFPDRDDVDNVEAGVWRARLDYLIQTRPELAEPFGQVIAEVRLAQAQAVSWRR